MEKTITLINNNNYGVSELKRMYNTNLNKGLVIAVIVHIFLIGGYFGINYYKNLSNSETKDKFVTRNIDIQEVQINVPLIEEPVEDVKTEQTLSTPQKDLSALIPVPTKRNESEVSTTKSQKELGEINVPVSKEGDNTGNFSSNNNLVTAENNELKPVETVETKKPEPIKDTYKEYEVEVAPVCNNLSSVRSEMEYPVIARDAGIEGKVTVKVLVGTDGRVVSVGAITGPDVFHDEVKQKVRDLVFSPGKVGDRNVKVWVSVPFSFRLKG